MPAKRGRPISSEVADSAQVQQREAWRRQQRDRRNRQRQEHPSSAQQTYTQLEQGERIISLTLTEEESAAATLLQLGIRAPGLTLPQDPNVIQSQQDAADVNEQQTLYRTQTSSENSQQPRSQPGVGFFRQFAAKGNQGQSTSRNQAQLSQFFPSLPPNNPLALHSIGPAQPNVSTFPSEESHPSPGRQHTLVITSFDDNINVDAESLDTRAEQQAFDVYESEAEEVVESVSIGNNADTPSCTVVPNQAANLSIGSEDLLGREHLYSDDSNDEESEVNFASERSAHSEDSSEVNEITPEEYMVQKLFEQLQGGFHSCSHNDHNEAHRQHVVDSGENHYGLGEIFHDGLFPSVLGLQELISSERLARQPAPSPAQWQAMFCGVPAEGSQRVPMNVCLHKEETQAVEPEVAFDVDSFLGFARTLGFARKGFWSQFSPQMRQNMATDVHLETRAFPTTDDPEQPTRSQLAMLRDVPHFLLGRIEGAHDIAVYVLLPHMAVGGAKFQSLTKDQLSRWTNQIYLPALHRFYGAHYTQHIPGSYRNAYNDSKAHQVEARQVETSSYQAQQSIGYHLQPEYLDQVWMSVLDTITNTPGLADFRNVELFFTAKNTKLQFKSSSSRPTLPDAMDYFQSYLEDVIDLDFVQKDRFYVDVGKEICPRVSLVRSQHQHIGDEAQVYLWKRCCLQHYINWMYDDQPPRKDGSGQQYYTQNMLYDAGTLTSVSPKQSKQRLGGLIYSQFYASVKELSDATKCFPFSNDAMEEMALDPQIRNAARNTAGGRRRDAKIVERGYLASKQRTRHALQDAQRKSFGIREEHRVSWELFQGLRSWLRFETHNELEITMTDCPTYAWAIRTQVYLDFLWRSADKFASGFEVTRALSRKDLVTWEQTKIMCMFLRCLRYVFGGHLLSRESSLWWSRRERTVEEPARLRVWYGLGFRNTLPRYKYCWLEPRIDWSRGQFQSEITDCILFGNSVLRGQYLRRGGQVQAFFDTTRRLELALDWLGKYSSSEVIRDRLVSWIVHICLQQFRVDVLHAVVAEIVVGHREEALKGEKPLCYDYFEEIMTDGCYLMSGNKTDFKYASHLCHFLFDFDDGLVRTHWEDRAFRVLYWRARTALRTRHQEIEEVFIRRFWRWLTQYHWVLPYPCGNALLQTTKQGKRMWYSIRQREEGRGAGAEWEWARKNWQGGQPEEIPRYIRWNIEQWEQWVEEHRDVR